MPSHPDSPESPWEWRDGGWFRRRAAEVVPFSDQKWRSEARKKQIGGKTNALPRQERFFVEDLVKFLKVSKPDIMRFALPAGLVQTLPGETYRPDGQFWFTAEGAQALAVHFRKQQGADYQRGRNPIENRDNHIERCEKYRAKTRPKKAKPARRR